MLFYYGISTQPVKFVYWKVCDNQSFVYVMKFLWVRTRLEDFSYAYHEYKTKAKARDAIQKWKRGQCL